MNGMITAAFGLFVMTAAAGKAPVQQEPDFEKLLKGATFSLTDALDKALALKEAKDGVVVNGEIEEENGKIIYSIQLAKGTKILEVNFDAKDGTLLPFEHEDGDKSAEAKAAKLTVKQCIEAALKREKGKPVEATLLLKEGKPVCEVKIYPSGGKLVTVSVNAETGELR